MRIRCNHKGGVGLPGLRFKFGTQDVDGDAWEKAVAANPQLATAFTRGPSPLLEILDAESETKIEKPQPPRSQQEAKPTVDETKRNEAYCPSLALKAADAIQQIAEMATVDALDRFVMDDQRRTIIQAAEKRRAVLGGG